MSHRGGTGDTAARVRRSTFPEHVASGSQPQCREPGGADCPWLLGGGVVTGFRS